MKSITRHATLVFLLIGLLILVLNQTILILLDKMSLFDVVIGTIVLSSLSVFFIFLSGALSSTGFVAEISGGNIIRSGTTVKLLSIVEPEIKTSSPEKLRFVVSEYPSRKRLFILVDWFAGSDSLRVGHTYVWDGEKLQNPFTTEKHYKVKE